jgi:hypothetical protein
MWELWNKTVSSQHNHLHDILGSGAYDYSVHQLNGDVYNNAGTNPPNTDHKLVLLLLMASGDIIGKLL